MVLLWKSIVCTIALDRTTLYCLPIVCTILDGIFLYGSAVRRLVGAPIIFFPRVSDSTIQYNPFDQNNKVDCCYWMRMLIHTILILMQRLMLLRVLVLLLILIAEKFTCTILLNMIMNWYTLLNMNTNIHSLPPSLGRCCSLWYDGLFLHLCRAVAQN